MTVDGEGKLISIFCEGENVNTSAHMSAYHIARSGRRLAIIAAAAFVLPAASALGALQPNGITIAPRVGNGNPTSTLTITNSNTNPGNVTIDDRGFAGAGTNRHDALASLDNGTTAYTFGVGDSFTISANFTLTSGTLGSGTPRKETGIEINGSPTGRALFIINSDAGEIVAFGGGMPFKSFGNNAGGNGYTPGTTITLGEIYRPGTGGNKGTLEYFIDRNGPAVAGGFETSGPLNITNVEGGPTNFTLGAYAQFSTNAAAAATDFGNVVINNLTVTTPEPATLASLALGGLVLRRRR